MSENTKYLIAFIMFLVSMMIILHFSLAEVSISDEITSMLILVVTSTVALFTNMDNGGSSQ